MNEQWANDKVNPRVGKIAKPKGDASEGKVTEIRKLMKRFGPIIERVRRDEYAWTQSTMADSPFWDRVVMEALIEFEERVKALEDLIRPESEYEQR